MTATVQNIPTTGFLPQGAAQAPPSPRKARSMRDTFLNMLGEFVALNKTPDFKLSPKSNQYLADAIREEVRAEREKRLREALFEQKFPNGYAPRHARTASTNSAYHRSKAAETFSLNPNGMASEAPPKPMRGIIDRRQSLPVIADAEAPLTFFQRVRRLSKRKISTSKAPDIAEVTSGAPAESLHSKHRRQSDAPTPAPVDGKEHHHCHHNHRRRHHSSSGARHNRRNSETDSAAPPSPPTANDTERRRTTRARKQKVSIAAMIADVAEETEIPTKC